MFDLLLRRARLVDDTVSDIALKDGKIAALGDVDGPALKTIELGGECYVSAGWIAVPSSSLIPIPIPDAPPCSLLSSAR